jgi:asparagine synthase (glutamine-hydrolysing)
MSGVAAYVTTGIVNSQPVLDAMLRRMTHYPWQVAIAPDSTVGLGAVTFERRLPVAHAADPGRQLTIVLDGEVVGGDAERPRLTGSAAGRSDAALILAGFAHEGPAFLARLNGEYNALIWDGARRELHVITDRFGLRPLYMATPPGACVVATEPGAVLEAPGVERRFSTTGVAQFFAFGHFFGDNTLFEPMRAVPAATCGTYRASDGSYTERRYWDMPATRPLGTAAEQAGRFDEAFIKAVERRVLPGEHVGLSLSGGLDARAILGVMPDGRDLQSVSLGIDGSLDHRSAAELARLRGIRHRPFTLDESFLGQFEQHLREMVGLTSGHYLDQGIVMVTMPVYRELGIEHLLRGHGGELLHMTKAYAYSLSGDALQASEAGLRDWLLSHLTSYMLSGVPDDLFTVDLRAESAASLDRALTKCPGGAQPIDRVWQMFINERLHRETALSMHMFEQFVGVRQPYLDNDVVDSLFAMPASMKLGDVLQTGLLRKVRPAFLDVANSNTGARMGAGRLETEFAKLRLRVGAKLGLKGYQPYERLGLWLRRELRPLVETTLSNEEFLATGMVRPDAVKRVVQQHMDNQANHTFLIMSLVIFALGIENGGSGSRV